MRLIDSPSTRAKRLFRPLRGPTWALLLVGGLIWAACGDEAELGLELTGSYRSNFGTDVVITDTEFDGNAISFFDNGDNVLVSQNPSDAMFFPDGFNRIVWTEPGSDGSFAFCTVAFGLDSADAARTSTQTADASDIQGAGCQGFPWTELTPQ